MPSATVNNRRKCSGLVSAVLTNTLSRLEPPTVRFGPITASRVPVVPSASVLTDRLMPGRCFRIAPSFPNFKTVFRMLCRFAEMNVTAKSGKGVSVRLRVED